MRRILCLAHLLLLALAVGCTSQPTKATTEETPEATLRFKPPFNNVNELTSRADYERYVAHYWDDFRFDIGDDIELYSSDELYSAFAQYVMLIPANKADSLLRGLMRRAHASRPVLNLFADMAHDILYDPNSPVRNDEYYIPILEELTRSPLLDEYDRMIPEHTLHIVKQNRIRSIANDFKYKTSDGRSHRLHAINADYTILLFNNPGCEMCKQVIDEIEGSATLGELGKKHNIVTLAIYPDEDIEAWRNYLAQMPKGWICGYDEGMILTNEKLYDLKAIPSLYLLDRDKHVLVKDGVSVKQVEEIIKRGIEL